MLHSQKFSFVILFMLAFTILGYSEEENQNRPAIAMFTPPKDWKIADQSMLTPHVKVFVIGPKLLSEMPPTMNLLIEPYTGTLKSYLKQVKKINESHGDAWKDLGSLKTKTGEASLSQVEVRSKWGGEKLMQAIVVKNGYAYVLTASAAKNEFGRFYQQFYNALRSLQIYNHLLDPIKSSEKREGLENAYSHMVKAYQQILASSKETTMDSMLKRQLFRSENFQRDYWQPFETMLKHDFHELGEEWQQAVLMDLQNNLLNLSRS